MKVLVTGATGFIGNFLVNVLLEQDYDVITVSRDTEAARSVLPSGVRVIGWEGNDLLVAAKSSGAIINLAGESIAGFPWNGERKRKILNSRLIASQRLRHVLSLIGDWSGVFIQASAIGIYGNQQDMECSELCVPGYGFLADVCSRWESQVPDLQSLAKRVITIRIGVVLGKDGGIFPQLLKQQRMHTGGKLGSGEQWISWIHIYDLVYGILFLLNDEKAKGVYNLVAPHPVKQNIPVQCAV